MWNRHRILILFVLFWVVMGVVVSLSCSNGQDTSSQSDETQPPPIWSSLVQQIVDWYPDAFFVSRMNVDKERIYVGGWTSDSGGASAYGWTITCSILTGNLDSDFDKDGKAVFTDLSGIAGLEPIGDSLFLLGGLWEQDPPPWEIGKLQERDATDGSLIATTICGPLEGRAIDMTLGVDSFFLLFDDRFSFQLERRLIADRLLVNTFGIGGVVTMDRDDVAKLSFYDNSIFVLRGGWGGALAWEIEKRNAETGEPDALFGIDGIVVSYSEEVGEPVGLAVDATGIYVLVSNEGFSLSKRSLIDGALIDSFGDQGIINATVDEVTPTGLALNEHSLFVAMTHRLTNSDSEWRVEAFNILDGKRITGFGLHGVMSRNVSDKEDIPDTIIADATGVYVAGRIDTSPYPRDVLVEKYYRGD